MCIICRTTFCPLSFNFFIPLFFYYLIDTFLFRHYVQQYIGTFKLKKLKRKSLKSWASVKWHLLYSFFWKWTVNSKSTNLYKVFQLWSLSNRGVRRAFSVLWRYRPDALSFSTKAFRACRSRWNRHRIVWAAIYWRKAAFVPSADRRRRYKLCRIVCRSDQPQGRSVDRLPVGKMQPESFRWEIKRNARYWSEYRPITFTQMCEPRHIILSNVRTNVRKYVVTWL